MTEAQKKAKAKYREQNGGFYIQFYKTDSDIKKRLDDCANAGEAKAAYIKRLIRADIEAKK